MKKRILVCALVAVFAAGCALQTSENSLPTMMTTTFRTEEATDTEAESVTETETETETEAETSEEITLTEAETSAEEETEAAETEAPAEEITTLSNEDIELGAEPLPVAASWSETAMSATMYVKQTDNNTGTVYARERAVIGATPIATYHDGDKVEVIAITDTGYYKIKSGAFIHTDYLTSEKVTKKTVKKTTVTEEEELIDDGDTQETTVTKKTVKKTSTGTTALSDDTAVPAPAPVSSSASGAAATLNGTVITAGNSTIDYTT
ncbi:MAG: hypothetical protein IJ080_01930, partial [Oscillospiraceae bacterium]|nr:hypothetical protein [Oscillospiraceae bacterium]